MTPPRATGAFHRVPAGLLMALLLVLPLAPAAFLLEAGTAEAQGSDPVTMAGGGSVPVGRYRGSGPQAVSLSLNNPYAEDVSVDITLSRSPATGTLQPSSYDDIVLGPGARRDLHPTIDFAAGTSTGTVRVRASYEVRNATGRLLDSGTTSPATFTITHPSGLTASLRAPEGPVTPGSVVVMPVMAVETWGWSRIDGLEARDLRCDLPGVAQRVPWGLQYERDEASLAPASSANPPPTQVGRLVVSVPSLLDPETYRYRDVSCSLTLAYDGGMRPGLAGNIDPLLPPALRVASEGGPVPFLFDTPKGDEVWFSRSVPVAVTNLGEQPWTGLLDLTSSSFSATYVASGASTFPATPQATTLQVEGVASLPAAMPEGTHLLRFSGAAPLLGSPELTVQVTHDARLQVRLPPTSPLTAEGEVLNLGPARLGLPVTHGVLLAEQLGYHTLEVAASVEATNAPTEAGWLDVPARALVPAGGAVQVPLEVWVPAGSPPGCGLSWKVTWRPLLERPQLHDESRLLTALSQMSNVEVALRELDGLALPPDEKRVLRSLLEDASIRGCGLASDDLVAVGRVVQAVPLLSALEGNLAELRNSEDAPPLERLTAAASQAQSLESLLRHDHPDLVPLRDRLEDQRAPLTALLEAHAEELAASQPSPMVLDRLGIVAEALRSVAGFAGSEPAFRAHADMRTRLEASYEESLAAMTSLFESPKHVPRGVAVSRDLAVNPNPLHWSTLDRMDARLRSDAALAEQHFAPLGPLGDRVEAAEDEAFHAMSVGRTALLAGAAVNALLAVGLVAAGTRTVTSYLRDLDEVQLGEGVVD